MTAQVKAFESETPLDAAISLDRGVDRNTYRTFGKRIFDISLTVLTLPFWLPLILVIAAILLTFGHRPFYRQQRLGMGGRTFWMVKFRTMVPNAESVLAEHLKRDPQAQAEWNRDQKLKNDPRITPLGRFLRKSSLDELPQLFNVLTGDMSLVGPRPMMIEQRTIYPGTAYYALRPGITGPWQVSDRNDCQFRDRAKYDSVYANEMSLKRDVALLFDTCDVVLRGTGY